MQNFVQDIVFRCCFTCTYSRLTLSKIEDVRYGECDNWSPVDRPDNVIYNMFTSACDDYIAKSQE